VERAPLAFFRPWDCGRLRRHPAAPPPRQWKSVGQGEGSLREQGVPDDEARAVSLQQRSRRLAWTSAVIHGLVHASVLMLPPLLGDLTRTFRVSLLEVLAVANAMYLAYGLCAVPAGFLADRFGSRRMLVLAALGCTLSLLLIAAAPSFALLSVGLVALGISAGVYHPSGLSLLSRGVTARERGRAIGIHGAGGTFGEAIAPAWAGFFAVTFDWRAGFIAAAGLSLACALLAMSLPTAESPPEAAADPAPARTPPSHHPIVSMRDRARTLARLITRPPLLFLLLSLVAAGFVFRGFLTFLPLHLTDAAQAGARASYFMSAVLVAGMVAQRLGGELADRRNPAALYLVLVVLACPPLALLALGGGGLAVAGALAFGFAWSLAQPVANALTAELADPDGHGLMYGLQFAATFGVGSFATFLGGLVQRDHGTRGVFLLMLAVSALQALVCLALFVLRRRR
jgi:MFS family permease